MCGWSQTHRLLLRGSGLFYPIASSCGILLPLSSYFNFEGENHDNGHRFLKDYYVPGAVLNALFTLSH